MRRILLVLFIGGFVAANGQENSPFSRYGLGSTIASTNISNRAMGGVSAAYHDWFRNTINFANPASFGNLAHNPKRTPYPGIVIFDAGLEIDNRDLTRNRDGQTYNSANFLVNYLYLGVPIYRNTNATKTLGLAFGLRPVTRLNYKIAANGRRAGDTAATVYEGSGGLNQITVGLGYRSEKIGYKSNSFSVGFNTGYQFGRKETITDVLILNDSLLHNVSRSGTLSNFSGLVLQGGLQYALNLTPDTNRAGVPRDTYGRAMVKSRYLRFGITHTIDSRLTGEQDKYRIVSDQYPINPTTNSNIDTIFNVLDQTGSTTIPSTTVVGLSYDAVGFSVTAEYENTDWTNFKFFGVGDAVANSYKFRVGAQFLPSYFAKDVNANSGFFNRAVYRAGFYFGKEYITADGDLPVWAVTLGLGMPFRKLNRYNNQSTMVNLSLEFGKTGNNANRYAENFVRVGLGFSLADIWFYKRKYD
jgi:hypothetical protein